MYLWIYIYICSHLITLTFAGSGYVPHSAPAKWSCHCLRSDEPDRASWSLQHLGSQLRYGRLVSPATWKDEFVGPGRILGSIQSDPSVSSFERFVSAPGRFQEQVPRNVQVAPDELRQTSAKSMDVWLLGWQNSSLLYSIQQNMANLLWIFFNPIVGDILINLTGLHKKRPGQMTKETEKRFFKSFHRCWRDHDFNILKHHSMQCSIKLSAKSRWTFEQLVLQDDHRMCLMLLDEVHDRTPTTICVCCIQC